MSATKIKAYLIHYTKYRARFESMKKTFRVLGLDFEVITKWDAEEIGDIRAPFYLWEERIATIRNILIANTMGDSKIDYISKLKISSGVKRSFQWMEPRALRMGEISVLLKHYNALLGVAYGLAEYGVIFEDDIFTDEFSRSEFDLCIDEFIEKSGNYMDIAGGASLESDQSSNKYKLELKYPARTRTNACYALHKKCARQLVDNFFPLCFPIDWHLQWIMSSLNMDGCYWTIKPPLIHGSEQGFVQSWRMP